MYLLTRQHWFKGPLVLVRLGALYLFFEISMQHRGCCVIAHCNFIQLLHFFQKISICFSWRYSVTYKMNFKGSMKRCINWIELHVPLRDLFALSKRTPNALCFMQLVHCSVSTMHMCIKRFVVHFICSLLLLNCKWTTM